jgi:hypothetical protein
VTGETGSAPSLPSALAFSSASACGEMSAKEGKGNCGLPAALAHASLRAGQAQGQRARRGRGTGAPSVPQRQ